MPLRPLSGRVAAPFSALPPVPLLPCVGVVGGETVCSPLESVVVCVEDVVEVGGGSVGVGWVLLVAVVVVGGCEGWGSVRCWIMVLLTAYLY